MDQLCIDCNTVLETSDKKKRKPKKRCAKCAIAYDKVLAKQNPGRYLGTKMRVQKRKHGSIGKDEADLYSKDCAQTIYELYQGKSYLSGVSDLKDLCITSKVKHPRTQDDLVLLTTKEASALGKKKTDEEKAAFLAKN